MTKHLEGIVVLLLVALLLVGVGGYFWSEAQVSRAETATLQAKNELASVLEATAEEKVLLAEQMNTAMGEADSANTEAARLTELREQDLRALHEAQGENQKLRKTLASAQILPNAEEILPPAEVFSLGATLYPGWTAPSLEVNLEPEIVVLLQGSLQEVQASRAVIAQDAQIQSRQDEIIQNLTLTLQQKNKALKAKDSAIEVQVRLLAAGAVRERAYKNLMSAQEGEITALQKDRKWNLLKDGSKDATIAIVAYWIGSKYGKRNN